MRIGRSNENRWLSLRSCLHRSTRAYAYASLASLGHAGGEDSRVLGEDWEADPVFLEEAKAWIFRNGWGYTMFMYSEHALAHSPPQRDDPSPRCALTVVYIPSLRYRFCLLHCRRAALEVAELVAQACTTLCELLADARASHPALTQRCYLAARVRAARRFRQVHVPTGAQHAF